MTTRPRSIDLDRSLLPGLVAAALFAVMAVVFLRASFDGITGFDEGVSVVEGIGYALIGAPEQVTISESADVGTEDFLVGFLLIAVLLDAALDGALMLAKRDDGGDEK